MRLLFTKQTLQALFRFVKLSFFVGLLVFLVSNCFNLEQNALRDSIIKGEYRDFDHAAAGSVPLDQFTDPATKELVRICRNHYSRNDFAGMDAALKAYGKQCYNQEVCNIPYIASCVAVWGCSQESKRFYDHINDLPQTYKADREAYNTYLGLYHKPPAHVANRRFLHTVASLFFCIVFGLSYSLVNKWIIRRRKRKMNRVQTRHDDLRAQKENYRIRPIEEMSPQSLRRVVDMNFLNEEEEAEALEVAELLEKQARVKQRA